MGTEVSATQLKQFYAKVLSDKESLEKFLAGPTSYITKELGKNPYNRELKVFVQRPTELYLVLPTPEDKEAILAIASDSAKKVITRALEDASFKKRLLATPKKAFVEESGTAIPDAIKVAVVENTKDAVNLVFAPKPESGELSEEELALVAGGWSWQGFLGGAIVGAIDGGVEGAIAGGIGMAEFGPGGVVIGAAAGLVVGGIGVGLIGGVLGGLQG